MNNPLVVGEPNIRFFAAAPLLMTDDTTVGVFYIFDRKPRTSFLLKERSELQTFARLLLENMTMQRDHLTHLRLDNLPLPDDGISDFSRIDTPDPASTPNFSPSPIRFYKDAPLPTYFSKGVDGGPTLQIARMPETGFSARCSMTQPQSIALSGYYGPDVADDVSLPEEDLSTVRQPLKTHGYSNSVNDFLSLSYEDCQEKSECDFNPSPAPLLRTAESVASFANSTKSKFARSLEPAPLRVANKTPHFEDAPRFPSPFSQPMLFEREICQRLSMISFRDEINEESHIEEENKLNQRESFASNTTDETSESLRCELRPLLDRDSIQLSYQKPSLNKPQLEQSSLKQVGTPQPGTVRAAIASLNSSLNSLKKSTLGDRFPSREFPVLAIQTAKDSSQPEHIPASETLSDDRADSPTITEGSEFSGILAGTVTPSNGDLSFTYQRQSSFGTANFLSSPTSRGSPTIVADLVNNSSGSQVNVVTPSSSSVDSNLDLSDTMNTTNTDQSDHTDRFYLQPKHQESAVSLGVDDLPVADVAAQFLPLRIQPKILEALRSAPPTTPLPSPSARPETPISFDDDVLSNAAHLCRVAAQDLAYDLIYIVDVTAPKINPSNPTINPSEISVRLLAAYGMDSKLPLDPNLHLSALRSFGIFTWTPPTAQPLHPSDFNLGLFQAIPTSYGGARSRSSGMVVAAYRRVSTHGIASDAVEVQEFVDFAKKLKGIFVVKFKSKIPQRKASSQSLREVAFPANEARPYMTTPNPMTAPEAQPISRLPGLAKKKSMATVGTTASMAKRTHTPVRTWKGRAM
jgi:hypothetical protein